jgi:hypothetical protein
MKKLRILILILGIFLSFDISAQVYYSERGVVELPIIKYRAIRTKFLVQDSIIYNKNSIIFLKDSIISQDSFKFKSYQRELDSKNNTIDTLSKEYTKLVNIHNKEKKDIKTNYKFWLGISIGVLTESIIFLIIK